MTLSFPTLRAWRLLVVLAVATLVPMLAAAQPARPQNPPDIAGEWNLANNEYDTTAQPPLGDYTGIAFNAAGVMRSETTAESIFGTPEYQCRPHSTPHQWRGLGGARILKEQDPLTREVRTYHIQFMRSLDRPVYMDGRPHPPAWAPHTWTGFSTGQWVGNTLKITTTHLKDGFLHRGGPQTSDMYTMTEFLTRHGDILTIVTLIDDPIYLDEPYIDSTTYTYEPTSSVNFETCTGTAFAESGGSDRHHVPHFLPGSNTADLNEWLRKDDWVPQAAARGGVKTIYPEYRTVVAGGVDVNTLAVPQTKSAFDYKKRIADQSPRDGQVHVMPVQGNVYLLIADGTNITASVGPDGVLVVNTGTAAMAPKLLDSIKQLSMAVSSRPMPKDCFGANCPGAWGWSSPFTGAVIASPAPPRPIRYIINTSAAPEHVGGNQTIAAAGFFPRAAGGFGTAVENVGRGASIVAHENVLNAMSAAKAPVAAQPTDAFFDEFDKLPEFVNGEAILMYAAPNATTDGDSFVFFRHSEVISAGNLFSTVSYPIIDATRGGTIQGVIDGLNKILDLAVAEYRGQGGTMIVPGRGRLSDTADVASYRNMLTIVRDRVKDLAARGQTLEQVRVARPTFDFDGRYGSDPAATDKFIEAVYRTVQEKK
jgi:cyclase